MRLYRASTRAPLQLGAQLGRGGEGTVFAVQGLPKLVAKIYLKPPSRQKIEKLRACVRSVTPELLRMSAWPTDLLLNDKREVCGFLMPRVASRADLHELYSPKSRAIRFPQTDFRFLVRAAANLARATALIHARGHVIGDVNHGNALVGRDGTIVLIDCDSFQIAERTRIHTCDVGVPLFTAPELQGMHFRGLRRTRNHDVFGLAVLIFHLLFQGRHPFACRYAKGELSVERAIAEYRFAYGADSPSREMLPPPGTLALEAFGAPIAALFERSFLEIGAREERPTPLQWIEALEQLESELVICEASTDHYRPGVQPCCWCDLESRTGLRFFGDRLVAAGRQIVSEVEILWKTIVDSPHPGASPSLPQHLVSMTARKPGRALSRGMSRLFSSLAAVVAGVLGISLLMGSVTAAQFVLLVLAILIVALLSPGRQKERQRTYRLVQASGNVSRLIERWNTECASTEFDEVLARLKEARWELMKLAKNRQAELDMLLDPGEESQRRRHLSAFHIDGAWLPGITPADITVLSASGIETAADIDRYRAHLETKVGAPLAQKLIPWYQAHVDQYRAAAFEPPSSLELQRLHRRYDFLQERLMGQLREGPQLLEHKHRKISSARETLGKSLQDAWRAVDEAQGQ